MKILSILKHIARNLDNDIHTSTGLLHNGLKAIQKSVEFMVINYDDYEVAPTTHKVNGFNVPLPISEKPNFGTKYFIIELNASELCTAFEWGEDSVDRRCFRRRMCFTTKQAAQQNALAMIGHNPETTNAEDV